MGLGDQWRFYVGAGVIFICDDEEEDADDDDDDGGDDGQSINQSVY